MDLNALALAAKKSGETLSWAGTDAKNQGLWAIADALDSNIPSILEANRLDLEQAEQNNMSSAMVDRLRLTEERIHGIADAVRYVAGLQDPIGQVLGGHTNTDGLQITKLSVPLGVVGIIFESRPNVTVDCAVLCLKSGNSCVLRGGKEAIHSNRRLVEIMRSALSGTEIPPDCIQLVEDTSRETATAMMKLNGLIDVLIPRGGPGLISSVVRNATVPVIETGVGNCHIYVDSPADLEMAASIVHNAKTSRPSVCNALETLLVHKEQAEAFLPLVARRLSSHAVELRGCDQTRRILGDSVVKATEEDYAAEFGDYILAVKVVEDIEEAIAHISSYSTHHSDGIVTENYRNSLRFTQQIDSAAVYVNASTRFTDGGVFGLGAEIGISTQKLHARGPMGLNQLTSTKYIIRGDGQIRE